MEQNASVFLDLPHPVNLEPNFMYKMGLLYCPERGRDQSSDGVLLPLQTSHRPESHQADPSDSAEDW